MESQSCYPVLEAVELSQDYANFLEENNPSIQENIVYAFNNEMARNHRRQNFIKTVHNLDAILISLNDTKIELSSLKLPWLPDFKVINLDVNLCKLCLDIDFKLGDLTVGGDYEVNDVSLQKVLPVSNKGAISINFTDVVVKGKVGLLIQGDSFMPENYDVEYTWEESEVAVSYFVDKEVKIENKIKSLPGEQVIAETVWLQVKEILTTILKEQLKGVVVEYSVQESLADEDGKLRELERYQAAKANGLFDTLLCAAKDYLVAKDLRTIETPPFNVPYRGKLTSTEIGLFESGKGFIKFGQQKSIEDAAACLLDGTGRCFRDAEHCMGIFLDLIKAFDTDLSTLSRLTDLSLFEDERQLFVYGTLGMREFKHDYETFRTKYEDNELTGSLKAQGCVTEIFIKLSFEKTQENPQKTQVEKIETRLLRDIETDTKGLGSLSWLIPKTQSWVIGHLRSTGMKVLLERIEEAFNYAIEDELRKTQKNDSEGEKSRMFWRNLFSK